MTFTGETVERGSAFSSDQKKTLLDSAGEPGANTAVGDAEGGAEGLQLTDGIFFPPETEDEAVDNVAFCHFSHN